MANDPQVLRDPQVPWTDEQWSRVNQVIQEEAGRARVAATFLPLHGPLPDSTDFIRAEIIPPGGPLSIQDTDTIQLATPQVIVRLRGAQMADPEMRSALALFRRAANVLARLEDSIVFRGLIRTPSAGLTPPPGGSPPPIWQILGGQVSHGLLAPVGSLVSPVTVPPPPPTGQALVTAVSNAIGQLEAQGHFGPFAAVLDQNFFLAVQTPDATSLVLPQDRINPFLGGGMLLRSSTLPENSGVVVALGGTPVELVVATDASLQFLQLTTEPMFVFRVRERVALRIKEANAIVTLAPPPPAVWAVSPSAGPVAGGIPVDIRGVNLASATNVRFGAAVVPLVPVPPSVVIGNTLITNIPLPVSPLARPGTGAVPVTVETPLGVSAVTPDSQIIYQ